MDDPEDDKHVKNKIQELIAFFEDPFNRKKIERSLQMPWRESSPLLLSDMVQFMVVHAVDNAQYGEISTRSRRSCCDFHEVACRCCRINSNSRISCWKRKYPCKCTISRTTSSRWNRASPLPISNLPAICKGFVADGYL